MPKSKRGKRKKNRKREWRKLGDKDSFISNNMNQDPTDILLTAKNNNLPPPEESGSLFVIDKKGDHVLSAQDRKLRARSRILYVQKGLIPPPDQVVNKKKRKATKQQMNKIKKRKLNNGSTKEESNTTEPNTTEPNTTELSNKETFYDIWQEEKPDKLDKLISENPSLEKGYLYPLEKKVKPLIRDKPSLINAVEVPKPGASFNPSEDEHQKLLKDAVDEQLYRAKEFDEVMSKLKHTAKNNNMELYITSDYEEESDGGSNEDDKDINEHVNIPNVPRLTQAERNKIKRRKIHEAIVKKNAMKKLLKSQTFTDALKEAEQKEDEIKKRQMIKEEKEERYKLIPKKLGKERIPEKDIEVLLTEQLPGSLRNLKPVTSLLEDRFHSFQKRNMIEPRSKKDYQSRYAQKLKVRIRHREFIQDQEKKYKEEENDHFV